MSVYGRYKKSGMDGFRNLVSLLETTPLERRQRMIDVGMLEDPEYTQQALQLMMNFADVLSLGDLELAELLNQVPIRILATAIHPLSDEVKARFLRYAPRKKQADLKLLLEGGQPALGLVGGAQLQMVGHLRELEKNGVIRLKRIPEQLQVAPKGSLRSA